MTHVIALFSPKSGVGTTTLAYHLAHMIARKGLPTLAVDMDPQADLTSAFLDEDTRDALCDEDRPVTVSDGLRPLLRGGGDIAQPLAREVSERLWLLPSDLRLAAFEDDLGAAWADRVSNGEAARRETSGLHRIVQGVAAQTGAEVVVLDVGPTLGAISRAALLAADHILVPVTTQPISSRVLATADPVLRSWRTSWQDDVLALAREHGGGLPTGKLESMGYVLMARRFSLEGRPQDAYQRLLASISREFAGSILDRPAAEEDPTQEDAHCLARLRSYVSLQTLARDARKPMFDLRAADGAIGSTARLVSICLREFDALADTVLEHAGWTITSSE